MRVSSRIVATLLVYTNNEYSSTSRISSVDFILDALIEAQYLIRCVMPAVLAHISNRRTNVPIQFCVSSKCTNNSRLYYLGMLSDLRFYQGFDYFTYQLIMIVSCLNLCFFRFKTVLLHKNGFTSTQLVKNVKLVRDHGSR